MTGRLISVLPYLRIDQDTALGNLSFARSGPDVRRAKALDRVFYDSDGRKITKMTVVTWKPSSPPDRTQFDTELDLTLQAIAFAIREQRVVGRSRGPAALRGLPLKPDRAFWPYLDFIDMLVPLVRGDNAGMRYATIDSFARHDFMDAEHYKPQWYDIEPGAPLPPPIRAKDYAPPFVPCLTLYMARLLRDPLVTCLLRCLEDERVRPFLTSLKWFNLSRSRTPILDTSHRLLLRSIAFEALLSLPRGGVGSMSSYALQILVPHVWSERLGKWAQDFYDQRSETVHRGRADRDKQTERQTRWPHRPNLVLSEIVFTICLKTRLGLLNKYDFPDPERARLEYELDLWLLGNQDRVRRICRVGLESLEKDEQQALDFLRYIDSINRADRAVDDESIRAAMYRLREVALEFIERLKTLDLRSGERKKLLDEERALREVNLKDRPTSYDLPLPVWGWSPWHSGVISDSDSFGHRMREWRRRGTIADLGDGERLGFLRDALAGKDTGDAVPLYLPMPYVALADLLCAMHELYELRKEINPL